jgi:hypothetical protein
MLDALCLFRVLVVVVVEKPMLIQVALREAVLVHLPLLKFASLPLVLPIP